MGTLEVLTNKLIGTSISRFSAGDTWDLSFGGIHLVAQDVISDDEKILNQLFDDKLPLFKESVDTQSIVKCAIVAALMWKEVIGIKINESCSIVIEFDGNFKLTIPTNVSVVDWQWCLNETGKNPYEDYIVACFWQGEIMLNESQN